jgi:unsaturated rhamnogalacturonyl hydrolase
VLDYLPADDPSRPALLAVLRDAADAVRRVQDPATGVWYQILDQPSRTGNYLEASASSMFVYALAKGARKGYLDPSYREAASRGFNGLVTQFVTVDSDGLVSLNGICKVAGLGGTPYRDGTFDYYVHEPVVANDYKGVGAFIMASLELNR